VLLDLVEIKEEVAVVNAGAVGRSRDVDVVGLALVSGEGDGRSTDASASGATSIAAGTLASAGVAGLVDLDLSLKVGAVVAGVSNHVLARALELVPSTTTLNASRARAARDGSELDDAVGLVAKRHVDGAVALAVDRDSGLVDTDLDDALLLSIATGKEVVVLAVDRVKLDQRASGAALIVDVLLDAVIRSALLGTGVVELKDSVDGSGVTAGGGNHGLASALEVEPLGRSVLLEAGAPGLRATVGGVLVTERKLGLLDLASSLASGVLGGRILRDGEVEEVVSSIGSGSDKDAKDLVVLGGNKDSGAAVLLDVGADTSADVLAAAIDLDVALELVASRAGGEAEDVVTAGTIAEPGTVTGLGVLAEASEGGGGTSHVSSVASDRDREVSDLSGKEALVVLAVVRDLLNTKGVVDTSNVSVVASHKDLVGVVTLKLGDDGTATAAEVVVVLNALALRSSTAALVELEDGVSTVLARAVAGVDEVLAGLGSLELVPDTVHVLFEASGLRVRAETSAGNVLVGKGIDLLGSLALKVLACGALLLDGQMELARSTARTASKDVVVDIRAGLEEDRTTNVARAAVSVDTLGSLLAGAVDIKEGLDLVVVIAGGGIDIAASALEVVPVALSRLGMARDIGGNDVLKSVVSLEGKVHLLGIGAVEVRVRSDLRSSKVDGAAGLAAFRNLSTNKDGKGVHGLDKELCLSIVVKREELCTADDSGALSRAGLKANNELAGRADIAAGGHLVDMVVTVKTDPLAHGLDFSAVNVKGVGQTVRERNIVGEHTALSTGPVTREVTVLSKTGTGQKEQKNKTSHVKETRRRRRKK